MALSHLQEELNGFQYLLLRRNEKVFKHLSKVKKYNLLKSNTVFENPLSFSFASTNKAKSTHPTPKVYPPSHFQK
jgi:hypothetical protein